MGIPGLHPQGHFLAQMTASPPVSVFTLFLLERWQEGEKGAEKKSEQRA